MLEKNTFVVKEQVKLLSSKKEYDILDAESGQPLGKAASKVSGLWAVLGLVLGKDKAPMTVEVREKQDDSLVFSVRRRGFLFKKIEALDAHGQVIGSYKAKLFSIKGGFNVSDKDGKPFCEIKGKLFKADYTFWTPDGKAEMGKVSKKWDGLAKALFTSADTYVVQVNPDFAEQPVIKMLVLGAAIAIDTLFVKAGKASGGGGGGDDD
ncbi:phospholipid scramblase-related protein [Fimbriiglobus ruber]|uniref:Scramblase n=1 Tax=Fimbriiglobus ruber TaxID=1908690 RepID=A0A225CZ15_9BACT|nr:phospholipid scramblase-related protein [Fimbriiglobus ruber]OWK34581.1 hypothetical protein FRUB_10552 [Fimbriiglobus ruber]